MKNQINSFDRSNLRQLSNDILAELTSLEKQYGVKFGFGGGRFDARTATIKVSVSLVGKDGKAVDLSAESFKTYARMLGLKASDLGKTFWSAGRQFKIVGANMRNRKYPVIGEAVGTGKRFKFREDRVKELLKSA